MSYSDVARTSAFAGALALLALGAPAHARRFAPPARQAVALELRIDAESYRRRLHDETCSQVCRTLEESLTDSVRVLLQRSYGFFDWGAAGARDTVVIRWVERAPPELPGSQLDLRIDGPVPRMNPSHISIDFDRYVDFSRREAKPAAWEPASLEREWAARLASPSTLLSPDLLVAVFGRIPIAASATFPRPGFAEVTVRPEDVAAAADTRPVFSVHTTITDPAANTADDAELILHKCKTTIAHTGYACEVLLAQYPSDRVTGQPLVALLGRARIAIHSVHVVEFVSQGQQSRFSGILPTEGLP